ncbi:MAG TPA: 5-deoxy-glucuronate isomerase [Candidatus Latescibacteria bacterium]|nr:5-deoxy-glucuronate isomerase [Candidatus Latescibacterota bacterium]
MGLRVRVRPKKGYNRVIGPGEGGLKLVEFGILNLSEGDSFNQNADEKETGLVVLSGKCTVRVDGAIFEAIGGRQDVFSGLAHAVYIPCKKSYEVEALSDVEIALCKAPSDLEGDARLITPDQVNIRSAGKLNWRRDIRDIIGPDFPARHLLVGETLNPPGNWSSVPPHRHDFNNPPEEVDMEEVYFFKIKPKGGFGVQRIYTDDRSVDEIYTIEENDTVIIPEGYHPVTAAPGYSICYLWVLAGEERVMRPRSDPQHAWLSDIEPILDEIGL